MFDIWKYTIDREIGLELVTILHYVEAKPVKNASSVHYSAVIVISKLDYQYNWGPSCSKGVDGAIHRINHYPVDSAIGFPNTYSPDRDVSDG